MKRTEVEGVGEALIVPVVDVGAERVGRGRTTVRHCARLHGNGTRATGEEGKAGTTRPA